MLELKIIEGLFSVCKVKSMHEIDFDDEFVFFSKTDEELSLVCRSEMMPKDATDCEPGWRAFRIEGQLDFSLVGILSKALDILAARGISVFAISTFNTDYILVKEEFFNDAIIALERNGYPIKGKSTI